MSQHSWCRWAILVHLVLAAVSSLPARAADDTAALPRYRLQVGDELNYEVTSLFEYTGGTLDSHDTWQVFVVDRQGEDGWRLVIRYTNTLNQKREQKTGQERATVYWASADINANGELVERFNSFQHRVQPQIAFPKLPGDASEFAKGWQTEDPFGGLMRYQIELSDDPQKLNIAYAEDRVENVIYGAEKGGTLVFDRQRGLLEAGTSRSKQTFGFKGEGQGETKLVDVKTHDADWCANLAVSAERFLVALDKFNQAIGAEDATSETRQEAATDLENAKADFGNEEFEKQASQFIARLETMKIYYTTREEQRKKLLDQAAPDFEAKDVDDHRHTLADYRGKIVLLDFWYRGCGWCIRCMPQLKEVADHYRDQPVALLGMNTDSNVEDAQFVIEKLALNYPTLRIERDLTKQFGVQGFPTLVMIDGEGKIRNIHSGWSPTLRDDLIKKIDRLLAEAK